jgi:pimeloyl-ACP methyl ester carboxylesterase
LIERNLIYAPNKQLLLTPEKIGLDFENVQLNTPDGLSLHGWYIPGPDTLTLVWFHGNAGNISTRLATIADVRMNLGYNIFIFDYRGYGLSSGKPSEEGTYSDSDAVMAYLLSSKNLEPSQTVLWGHSLGCAIATEVATKYPTRALILQSGFTSIPAMSSHKYPCLPGVGFLTKILFKTKYDILSKLGRVHVPILVIHGDQDSVVPHYMGETIFSYARSPKRFYSVKGAGHKDMHVTGGSEYYKVLYDFMENPRKS